MSAIQQMLLASSGGAAAAYNAETIAWAAGIVAAGGTVTTQEKDWADALILAIQGASYGSKIIWLNPFLGSNIIAARMPLRDTRGVGIMGSVGSSPFVDADCGNAVGIQNPTEKNAFLSTLIGSDNLKSGDSSSGGMGFYERNWGNGTGTEPMGCYNAAATGRYVIDLRPTLQRFRWDSPTGSQAGPATTAGSKHYYGQCIGSTNTTQIYADGASLGSDGTSTSAGTNEPIYVMGCRYPSSSPPYKGRCAVAYLTDGTFSSGDVAAFHTLLGTYLITPTGR